MKNIAVVLSGCGVFDGAEITETVLTLLAIEQNNAKHNAFAPNINQEKVVNHFSNEADTGQTRNVLHEAARIMRGDIADIKSADVNKFDGLIFPGGFGAALNLCDFVERGADMSVNADVLALGKAFYEAKKPIGFICIAPVMAAKMCGAGVQVTIGNDAEVAAQIEKMGAKHVECSVDKAIVDEAHKVVSTPAYMLAQNISQAQSGIADCVQKLLQLI